ncbi:D-tyrosyl-tRNA(Tyr) deacylase 1-like protein [Leptotrombidium deliense]|uniref:D-aminoacyl-tRNA deacylase n=1 Tax=Leptotrombidium deliense TaxID=299467 RepID=A0A443RY33_9ACAR|nr:D-tyrosyl-tRNA(Tyr) deacylase 1-like protein [Leptotrombidium deliense]
MKAVVQRVSSASVVVNGNVISSINKGICVLIGISRRDTQQDADYIIRKLLNLRLFENANGKRWDLSVKEKQFEILCVSQFTLYSVLKGNKLDFHNAMNPLESQQFYETFLENLKKSYDPQLVKDGKFGEYMQVDIKNDGPVTITLDSQRKDGSETVETL